MTNEQSTHWLDETDDDAPTLPDGTHEAKITRVKTTKNGAPWYTSNGNPLCMIVMQNDQGAEAVQFLHITKKAAWKVKQLITRCRPPVDVAKMKQAEAERGLEPGESLNWFHDQAFATRVLVGREVTVRVVGGEIEEIVKASTPGSATPKPPANAMSPVWAEQAKHGYRLALGVDVLDERAERLFNEAAVAIALEQGTEVDQLGAGGWKQVGQLAAANYHRPTPGSPGSTPGTPGSKAGSPNPAADLPFPDDDIPF